MHVECLPAITTHHVQTHLGALCATAYKGSKDNIVNQTLMNVYQNRVTTRDVVSTIMVALIVNASLVTKVFFANRMLMNVWHIRVQVTQHASTQWVVTAANAR